MEAKTNVMAGTEFSMVEAKTGEVLSIPIKYEPWFSTTLLKEHK